MFLININTHIAQQKKKKHSYFHTQEQTLSLSLSLSLSLFLVLSLKLTEKTHFVAHNCFPFLSVETEIKIFGGQFCLRIEFGVSFSSLFFACCSISL